MAAATVGIAVHGGAETCLRAADVFATRTGLAPVTDAVMGSRRALSAIRRGIAISLAYNAGHRFGGRGIAEPTIARSHAAELHFRCLNWPCVQRLSTEQNHEHHFSDSSPSRSCSQAGAVAAFAWATHGGQFDDLRTPALRALHDPSAPRPALPALPKAES